MALLKFLDKIVSWYLVSWYLVTWYPFLLQLYQRENDNDWPQKAQLPKITLLTKRYVSLMKMIGRLG